MIVGIGVDVVDLARFERAVTRTPRLVARLFTAEERGLPLRSLAGRFAAKEALIKALGGSDGVRWQEMTVRNGVQGEPVFVTSGETAGRVRGRGITRIHVSMSHDAGVATAFVVAEGER
ncbi:holo-ACP synthase [Mycetocola reblochoni]|uniref:Holo-[acyl-carrier-protein] synthase n=2 Tax=Mycetocola reblochoni TaxID=331618 RepID=A0A1R4I9H6_9MICO|nr:holo-ACP synthase [Mycetocola reblochoni]RLP69189.1 holo-ACP synthase [Mycetocola reblochoni]SJN16470.1 Holo-[acyl-carrier protein] synthase [Mycetocola reblochoni REB411]